MIGFTEGGLRFLQYKCQIEKKSKIVVYYINDRKLSIAVVIVVILILNLFL